MFLSTSRGLFAGALLCSSACSWADSKPVHGESLSLHQAISRTLLSNPELAAFAFELTAQDGRTLQAGLPANPELVLDLEDALGTGARSGLSELQTTLSLRKIFERGALARRVAAAQAGRAVLDAELLEKQLDTATETARRFARVLADQARLDVAREAITQAEQAVAAVRVRVLAAKSPDAELARAAAALARAELEHEDAEHEWLTGKFQLAAMWGAREVAFDQARGELEPLPELESFAALSARIQNNPSLSKFTTEAQLREAELRLAEQRRKPAWQLAAGIRRFEAGDDFAGVFNVTVPLSFGDRGQGNMAAAQAKLQQVDATRNAAEVRLLSQVFTLHQELAHARHVSQKLASDVLPKLTEALQQTEYAYQRGRYGYLELVAAQRELLELKRARIQASVDAYGYAIELDRLTGTVPRSAATLSAPKQ